ncbi:hypothetical protein [[Clostridium] colinum]|uniref:hypothetical protein n=1 Tax=[Clostridium] colinum TaxID=36835 RepID=UPI002024ACB8|nr:hypothetical protein [[Clostridium] colinum]
MNCPNCGKECHIITETNTTGKDFSGGKACCGVIFLGWIGLLCGACGKGKQTHTKSYWVCGNCGNKFKI